MSYHRPSVGWNVRPATAASTGLIRLHGTDHSYDGVSRGWPASAGRGSSLRPGQALYQGRAAVFHSIGAAPRRSVVLNEREAAPGPGCDGHRLIQVGYSSLTSHGDATLV